MQEAAAEAGTPVVLAYDQSGKKLLSKGVLDVINNQIDQASGTIRLKARFDNKDHKLWPGAFVQVARGCSRPSLTLLAVPSEAVQHGPRRSLRLADFFRYETAHRQPIEVVAIQDDQGP